MQTRVPWYTFALGCAVGQLTCWVCLIMFYGSGKTSKHICLKLCENADECSICHDSVPFFSFTGAERPQYFVFGVGLTLSAIIGLAGIDEVNRMYFRLGELIGLPREPSFIR
eukprot:3107901-Pyramimonas_sp.AAC.2